MGTMRVFVGIVLPEFCQEIVAGLACRLAPLSPGPLSGTRRGNAHLTLKFLGDVAGDGPCGIDAVCSTLSGVVFAPFDLQVAGGGFFPEKGRPRVIWAGLAAGAAPCRELADAVDRALSPLGFPPEPRPFAAHLTLARLKNPGRDGDWSAVLRLLAATVWPEVTVSDFALCRSHLTAAGARYEILERFPAREG